MYLFASMAGEMHIALFSSPVISLSHSVQFYGGEEGRHGRV